MLGLDGSDWLVVLGVLGFVALLNTLENRNKPPKLSRKTLLWIANDSLWARVAQLERLQGKVATDEEKSSLDADIQQALNHLDSVKRELGQSYDLDYWRERNKR